MGCPLVTFALIAYKQERYIREAVEAAFAQTYDPLEIILSDDCSPDRTFDIMQSLAAEYRGPHKVIVNRNPVNRGIGSHANRVMELASGELVVFAAGDDVSLPERTAALVDAYENSQRRAAAIYGPVRMIDEAGVPGGRIDFPLDPRAGADLVHRVAHLAPAIVGASHAVQRRIFEVFGPLRADVIAEDRANGFRACELGEVVHIDQELVKYRTHESNISWNNFDGFDADQHRARCLTRARMQAASYRQILDDLQHPLFAAHHSATTLAAARAEANKHLRLHELEAEFIQSGRLRRVGITGRGLLAGNSPRKSLVWLARTLCPESWYQNYTRRAFQKINQRRKAAV